MKKENLMGESASVLNAIEFRSSWGLFHIQPLKTQIKILDWTFWMPSCGDLGKPGWVMKSWGNITPVLGIMFEGLFV